MKSISLLNIASSMAALTVLLIALILIPEPLWTSTTIATAFGFAGAVGYIFYVPSILRKNAKITDASQLSSIGPLGAVSIVLLIASGSGFLLSLGGYQKFGLAMLIFGIGAALVLSLVLSAALKVVDSVSAKWSQPSQHVNWQNQIAILVSQSTHQDSLAKLHALQEKLRYSASDVPGGSPQDEGIQMILNLMSEGLQSDTNADLAAHLGSINGMLMQRNAYLRSVRSKA